MHRLSHLRIAEIKLPPGEEWMDAPAAWRFVRVHSGSAYWLGVGQNRPLVEGELLVIPPGDNGIIRVSQLGEVVLQGFCFVPDLLYGFFSLAQRHFFETRVAVKPGDVQFLPSTHPVAQRLAAAVSGPKAGDLVQRLEALGIVVAVFDEELARHRPPASRGMTALHRFKQIITQMPDSEIVNHPPDALARLCGCSLRHFNRLFHDYFGESTSARQTEVRLLKAHRLLGESDEKIIHVALESGYRSLSLFNSLFKKRFGMTPSAWRQKAAKKAGRTRGVMVGLMFLFLTGAAALQASEIPQSGTVSATQSSTAQSLEPADRQPIAAAREALHQKLAELDAPEKGAGAIDPSLASHLVLAPPKPSEPEPITRARKALLGKMAELEAGANGTNGADRVATNGTSAGAQTNGPAFEVRGYELHGNTLLPAEVTDPILQEQIGPAVTFGSIRQGLADLQMAYRARGYATVAVGLPQQQLTNGIVKVQVTEGRLVDINVVNNRHFSSNNVLRELPSLRTNAFLNALVFQQELDRANANRDRQIYPVIAPGPEPGTSALELRVKDRLPLHARFELNNNSTPASPELRMNVAGTYDNLWQLDHQFGVQYSFTPEALKEGGYNFYTTNGTRRVKLPLDVYDQPLIANYSAFYRMPLSGVNGPARQSDYPLSSFGYDEATRRFRPPPPTGASELLFYASRSLSDTAVQLQSQTNTPAVVPPAGGLQIANQIFSRTLNPNEDIGVRWVNPLPNFQGIDSTLSLGMDFKNYRSLVIQDHVFQAALFVPLFGTNGPPWDPPNGFQSPPTAATQPTFVSVQYLPFSISYNATRADKSGVTSLDLGSAFQFADLLGSAREFESVAGDRKADGRYFVFTAGLTREQKVYHDWGVRFHADGQWANEPLLSNEQFSLGGAAGIRGYHEGEQYGDTGWRVQIEPHSPYLNLGMVDGTVPMLARLYAFVDYGQRYHLGSALPGTATLFGTGFGFNASIGERVDFRAQMGVALRATPPGGPFNQPDIANGDVRVTFGVGVQF